MIPKLYPNANGYHLGSNLLAVELFKYGSPKGVTVHYTASGSIVSAINEEERSRLGYHLIIDRDGSVVQTCHMTYRVNHAGKAMWNGISPNQSHLAIAFVSWGLLDAQGQSYTGMQIPTEEIRTDSEGRQWHIATAEQEKSLMSFLLWCIRDMGFKRENICGHDECCIPTGRKVDPGASLSFKLDTFRKG